MNEETLKERLKQLAVEKKSPPIKFGNTPEAIFAEKFETIIRRSNK